MGGFKSRIKNRLTRHASYASPHDDETIDQHAIHRDTSTTLATDIDDKLTASILNQSNTIDLPSAAYPPRSSSIIIPQKITNIIPEQTLTDNISPADRKTTNTSVTNTNEPLPTPLPTPLHETAAASNSAFVTKSTRSLSQDLHFDHRHSPPTHAPTSPPVTQQDDDTCQLLLETEKNSVQLDDHLADTACFDYAVITGDKTPLSTSNSIRSKDINTLESSTWTEALPPSIDEKPELVLQQPSPESQELAAPVAESLHQTILRSTNDPSSDNRNSSIHTNFSSSGSNRMGMRKVWVKRPGAAATLVSIRDDDMVDDAKDMILRKYGNSLGRQFDAPDVVVKLIPRDQSGEIVLSPDEELCRAMDKYYHGTQKMHEALIIHVPQRKAPKHSPGGQIVYHHHNGAYYPAVDDPRPHESGTDYFPLVHPNGLSPGPSVMHDARAISVLTTGQLPPLASPGGRNRAPGTRAAVRPNFARHSTASPTALTTINTSRNARPRLDSSASDKHSPSAGTAPLVTPPVSENIKSSPVPPTPRVASPRPRGKRQRQKTNNNVETTPALPPSFLDTSVPPINVLIVEDNMINMRLLEQFVRRLKVHWATAVNGREAVNKWRQGGFHLVLMDIQLPIMSGLDATREIRRLERINHIGVLSGSSQSNIPPTITEESEKDNGEVMDEDKLGDTARMFKSPVIIVALTASNLQSDRHEALAAGCNDFLTKVYSSLHL